MFVVKNKEGDALAFYYAPKNASTTTKALFVAHLGIGDQFQYRGQEFIDHEGKRIKQTDVWQEYMMQGNGKVLKDVHDIDQITSFGQVRNHNFMKDQGDMKLTKVCVVRDPVARFISCYNHLVTVEKGNVTGSPEEVLNRVKRTTERNYHFWPQTHWLGEKADFYDHVFTVDQLDIFAKHLDMFFGKHVQPQRLQTSGSSVDFPVPVDDYLIGLIKEAYASDYEAFGEYFD